MPMYDYKCSACEHTFTEYNTIANRKMPTEQPCTRCKAHGTVEIQVGATAVVAGANYHSKVPTDFRNLMTQMKAAHPRSNIDV